MAGMGQPPPPGMAQPPPLFGMPDASSVFRGGPIPPQPMDVFSNNITNQPPINQMFGAQPLPQSMGYPPVREKKKKKEIYKKRNRKFRQEVDTNVVSIGMKVLQEDPEVVAGDAVFCFDCQAVFNMHSVLTAPKPAEGGMEVDEDDQIWVCEFCNHENTVNLDEPEIPKIDAVNYILENAHAAKNKQKNEEAQAIVFCVDISGSMCVTKPMKGKYKIKGDRTGDMQDLMKFSDGSDQFAFKDKGMTYVSRLQCVQAAIESQVQTTAADHPKRKIGLVTFNHEVQIIGDGTQNPSIINGDKLSNYDFLLQNGTDSFSTHLT